MGLITPLFFAYAQSQPVNKFPASASASDVFDGVLSRLSALLTGLKDQFSKLIIKVPARLPQSSRLPPSALVAGLVQPNYPPTILEIKADLRPDGKTAVLSVKANDDGGTAKLTYEWFFVQGPELVSFRTPRAAGTLADLKKTGFYTFKVTVTDKGTPPRTAVSGVTMRVNPSVSILSINPETPPADSPIVTLSPPFLTPDIQADGSVKLVWAKMSGVRYEVLRKKQGDVDFAVINTTAEGAFTDSGVEMGMPYAYKIRAKADRADIQFSPPESNSAAVTPKPQYTLADVRILLSQLTPDKDYGELRSLKDSLIERVRESSLFNPIERFSLGNIARQQFRNISFQKGVKENRLVSGTAFSDYIVSGAKNALSAEYFDLSAKEAKGIIVEGGGNTVDAGGGDNWIDVMLTGAPGLTIVSAGAGDDIVNIVAPRAGTIFVFANEATGRIQRIEFENEVVDLSQPDAEEVDVHFGISNPRGNSAAKIVFVDSVREVQVAPLSNFKVSSAAGGRFYEVSSVRAPISSAARNLSVTGSLPDGGRRLIFGEPLIRSLGNEDKRSQVVVLETARLTATLDSRKRVKIDGVINTFRPDGSLLRTTPCNPCSAIAGDRALYDRVVVQVQDPTIKVTASYNVGGAHSVQVGDKTVKINNDVDDVRIIGGSGLDGNIMYGGQLLDSLNGLGELALTVSNTSPDQLGSWQSRLGGFSAPDVGLMTLMGLKEGLAADLPTAQQATLISLEDAAVALTTLKNADAAYFDDLRRQNPQEAIKSISDEQLMFYRLFNIDPYLVDDLWQAVRSQLSVTPREAELVQVLAADHQLALRALSELSWRAREYQYADWQARMREPVEAVSKRMDDQVGLAGKLGRYERKVVLKDGKYVLQLTDSLLGEVKTEESVESAVIVAGGQSYLRIARAGGAIGEEEKFQLDAYGNTVFDRYGDLVPVDTRVKPIDVASWVAYLSQVKPWELPPEALKIAMEQAGRVFGDPSVGGSDKERMLNFFAGALFLEDLYARGAQTILGETLDSADPKLKQGSFNALLEELQWGEYSAVVAEEIFEHKLPSPKKYIKRGQLEEYLQILANILNTPQKQAAFALSYIKRRKDPSGPGDYWKPIQKALEEGGDCDEVACFVVNIRDRRASLFGQGVAYMMGVASGGVVLDHAIAMYTDKNDDGSYTAYALDNGVLYKDGVAEYRSSSPGKAVFGLLVNSGQRMGGLARVLVRAKNTGLVIRFYEPVEAFEAIFSEKDPSSKILDKWAQLFLDTGGTRDYPNRLKALMQSVDPATREALYDEENNEVKFGFELVWVGSPPSR